MERTYTALLSIHPRSDRDVLDAILRGRVAEADLAREASWRRLGLIVLAGAVAASVQPVDSAIGTLIATSAVITALVLLGWIIQSVAQKHGLAPREVSVHEVPYGLGHAPRESLDRFFRAVQPHPELRRVVWEWIRSGHPIRVEQVQVAERYLAEKQVSALTRRLPRIARTLNIASASR